MPSRPAALLVLACTVWAVPAAAQQTFCFQADPRPACSTYALTHFGLFTGSRLRVVADWAVMANVSAHDAIGVSVFASVEDEVPIGPAARYRRWLSPRASLDVAIGTQVVADRPGSIFGLVRWSPTRAWAIAVRPELLGRRTRVSIGMEAGDVPGRILSVAGGAFLLLWKVACSVGRCD